jgi:hypothetical protein
MQPAEPFRPPEVVSGEQEGVAEEEGYAAPRVARDGDGDEVVAECHWRGPLDLALDLGGVRGHVGAVEDAVAASAPEGAMVGDVVAVGGEHEAHPAEAVDALEQARRRIDEDVPASALDEVARGAERGLGGEATVVDLPGDQLREGVHSRSGVELRHRSNRGCRAGDERHERPALVLAGRRLRRTTARSSRNGRTRRERSAGRCRSRCSSGRHRIGWDARRRSLRLAMVRPGSDARSPGQGRTSGG